jgi:hypothetical protein
VKRTLPTIRELWFEYRVARQSRQFGTPISETPVAAICGRSAVDSIDVPDWFVRYELGRGYQPKRVR